jgi:hypothetical protein
MHRQAIFALLLSLGCAASPDDSPEPLSPEHTTQSIPAVDAELVGLCVNAAYDKQRPEADAWCDLAPTWIRSIVYKTDYENTFALLHAYRMRGVRAPKVLALFNQESVAVPGPASPFFGEKFCDFNKPVPADELAKYEAAVAAYGPAFGDAVSSMIGNYGDAFDAVELFNEPDGKAGGCLRAKDFATILIAAIPKISPVLVGKPFTIGSMIADWRKYMPEVVDRLYEAGVDYDGFSFHPYEHFVEDAKGQCPSAWVTTGGSLHNDIASSGPLSAYGIANRHPRPDGSKHKLWITEFGMPLQAEEPGCTVSDYVTRAFREMNGLRDEDGQRIVEHAFWFAWDDRTHYAPEEEYFGLVDRDHAPRPAARAFARLTRAYDNCPFSCRTPSKCENDLPPNEIDTATCEAAIEPGAKCATEARHLMECVFVSQECEAGYTRKDVREYACTAEREALAACK